MFIRRKKNMISALLVRIQHRIIDNDPFVRINGIGYLTDDDGYICSFRKREVVFDDIEVFLSAFSKNRI